MTHKVRAKFRVDSIAKHSWGGSSIKLSCTYDDKIPEDQRFQKATPSGTIEMQIDNPAAVELFELGKYFYADFFAVPVLPEELTEASKQR